MKINKGRFADMLERYFANELKKPFPERKNTVRAIVESLKTWKPQLSGRSDETEEIGLAGVFDVEFKTVK